MSDCVSLLLKSSKACLCISLSSSTCCFLLFCIFSMYIVMQCFVYVLFSTCHLIPLNYKYKAFKTLF